MLTRKEIEERGLKVFVLIPNTFPKEVKLPEEVDVDNKLIKFWVPELPSPEDVVVADLTVEPDLSKLEAAPAGLVLKEEHAYIIVMDSSGNVVAESTLDE